MNKKEIAALRKKLPQRGYTIQLQKNGAKSISTDRIRKFFYNGEVKEEDEMIIVEAAVKTIEKNKKHIEKLRTMAARA